MRNLYRDRQVRSTQPGVFRRHAPPRLLLRDHRRFFHEGDTPQVQLAISRVLSVPFLLGNLLNLDEHLIRRESEILNRITDFNRTAADQIVETKGFTNFQEESG